jgi:pilus assembly protein CpaB
VAAGCAALAVVILASFLRPSGPALVDILTATTDLPAGSTLTAEDISTQPFPADHIPPGAFTDTTQLIGRLLAAPMAQGEAVTQTRLMSVGPRADGLHTVPVRLADAEMADLLAPGAIIDLVLPMGDTSSPLTGEVIAAGARVVTVPRRPREGTFGASPRSAGSLVVVATDRRTAVALAAVGLRSGLGVIIQ